MAEREQEVFLPEEVDEQIDEYLTYETMHEQAPDSSAEQAVQALQHHFAPAAEDAALQRVWQRFEQKQTTMRKTAYNRITIAQKRRYRVSSLDSYKEGRSSVTHRLNLAVAVIFALLLVGSMAVLFRLAPNRNTIVSSAPKEKIMFVMANRTLYRLDMKTHQPLWHIAGMEHLGQLVGDTYYATTTNGTLTKLYALDVASGKVRWQVDSSNNGFSGDPEISNNTLYFSTIRNNGDSTVLALDAANGAKKWENRLGTTKTGGNITVSIVSLTAASNQAVYGEIGITRNNKYSLQRFALNAHDGKKLWQKDEELTQIRGWSRGFVVDGVQSMIKTNRGTLEQGYLIGYDTTSGKQLWSKTLWSNVPDNWVSLVNATLLNGIVYVNTAPHNQGNSLYAFSAKDGTQLWHYQDMNKTGNSYPTVTENGIYFNRYAGQTLVALDTATGKIRWMYNFHDALTVEYPPAADNDQVYLSLANNVIQILRASDGKPLGSFKVGGKVDPNNRVIIQVTQ